MTRPDTFTPEQERSVARALAAGEPPDCPACSVPLDRRGVPPRSDVSYVRRRVLLVCPKCHGTLVLDEGRPR